MAKQVAGVYKKLFDCAMKEFLEKGYKDASLREIAKAAGTGTSSIYTRFHDKEGLFRAIVEPVADGLKEIIKSGQNAFGTLPADEQSERVMNYGEDHFSEIVSYIYSHMEEFRLLVSFSYGTPYANFIHDLSTIDAQCCQRYIEATGNDAITSGRASVGLLHLLSSGFYSGLLEVVVHNVSEDDARQDLNRLRAFYAAGWAQILNF